MREIEFYNIGYRVGLDGSILNPRGKKIKGGITSTGYIKISARINGVVKYCKAHRLQAFQKYGSLLFNEGIEVRHLNGIQKDNSSKNIAIGTHSDNILDIPKETRIKSASNANKKYFDDLTILIKSDKKSGFTYRELMIKYNINSKGTLFYIIKNR